VVDIDGSNEKQLTDIPKNWEAGGWSPDGSKIVYTSWKKSSMGVGETQKIGIWMMNADGSGKKLLTKVAAGGIECMEWSPDGSKTALVTWILRKDKVDRDIYVIDVIDN
jgi:Tol biopolymer transport system component